jgi:hypothetical protein
MSYIIIAEVRLDLEENMHGDIKKVNARILSKNNNSIVFDIPGDFHNQQELTKQFCNTLVDAGFFQFEIKHSY